MEKSKIKHMIEQNNTYLGIELGSTRIKAVLISDGFETIASSEYNWENIYKDGYWTYPIEKVFDGIQSVYKSISQKIENEYEIKLKRFGAIGFSAMMHGYIVLDKNDELLVPFRTWRNTTTSKAAEELTKKFNFNIPQRWSIAHLYQAILNKEKHVKDIKLMTTLSGYVHYMLTNKKVIGIGDASGMFPIDSDKFEYNSNMIEIFGQITKDMPWKISDILPEPLKAGDEAGYLTKEGALLIDPTGNLEANILLCPPEGDAGTGMVATNSVVENTGNVSAGTSIFSMVVLDKGLSKIYEEIDIVATPTGKPVAMVHCNNCTNEINAWARILKEFLEDMGYNVQMSEIFETMFKSSLKGDKDAGELIVYNYLSGEHITSFESGRPLFVRKPESKFNFSNFMKAQLYSALATLKIGMDILKNENVEIKQLFGHGGYFKTKNVGQSLMAAAVGAKVCIMETAGEGGAWGMAVLAAYTQKKKQNRIFEDFLQKDVFRGMKISTVEPVKQDVEGFNKFMKNYILALEVQKKAVEKIL